MKVPDSPSRMEPVATWKSEPRPRQRELEGVKEVWNVQSRGLDDIVVLLFGSGGLRSLWFLSGS